MIEYEARRHGYPVRIVLGGNRRLRKLLTVLGLHQQLPSFDSIDDAMNH
jgi:hypothetical protein